MILLYVGKDESMDDPTSSYYLRLTAELRRRLRHRCIETGRTMNAEILAALTEHLDAEAKSTSSERVRP